MSDNANPDALTRGEQGLAVHTLGAGGSNRVVLLHGFTQNARCWGRFGSRLVEWADVAAVDLPGHGESRHDRADLWRSASLVARPAGRAPRPAILVGYSMGGRVALHLALQRPDLVERLVLIGATAGIDDAEEREKRRQADEALADRVMELGTERFVDHWLSTPLFAHLTAEQAHREARLANRAEGLAGSLRHCGTGTQEPLWGRLAELEMPVMLMVGADDAKFTAVAERMVTAIGSNAEVVSCAGGHAPQLERPDEAADAIRGFVPPA